jgi:TolB-like protein
MKKLIFCLILGLTAGVVFGQANVPAIVVSTFSTRGQAVTRDDAESITELFMAELAKQNGVRVVDRTSLDRVVAEMRFQTSDWSNSQKTAQLGAALNAEFLVRGQINQLGSQVSVAITALDIKTLEVVSSSTQTFDINTIYDAGKDGYYDYQKISIFGKMPSIAGGIANPIKTKMTELAKQRQEQAQRREQESVSLVGKWLARGNSVTNRELNIIDAENSMEITFYSDGTLYITLKQSWSTSEYHAKGPGNYTRNGDKLSISWDEYYYYQLKYFQVTTGSGRNRTKYWDSSNDTSRQQRSFDVTIEFSQNGKNMTWDRMGYNNIPELFVRQ